MPKKKEEDLYENLLAAGFLKESIDRLLYKLAINGMGFSDAYRLVQSQEEKPQKADDFNKAHDNKTPAKKRR